MLVFLMPNPPVPAVPKAVVSASNKGMSPNRSSRISMTVIPR